MRADLRMLMIRSMENNLYAIKLMNGAVVGAMSLTSALRKMRDNVVVVAVVRRIDGMIVR